MKLVQFFFLLCLFWQGALAAVESGFGLYLLGYQSSKAGYLPPPGVYFRNDVYHHPGHIKGAVFGGILEAKAHAKISLDLLTFSWVTPIKFLGADLAIGTIIPFGRVNVHAKAQVDVPNLVLQKNGQCLPSPMIELQTKSTSKRQTAHGIADTLIIPLMLGWHVDDYDLHFLTFQGVYVPTGKYTKGHIANMGQNHFATETDAGFTWLYPKTGTEISAITGVTVNFTNHKIHYRSGSEWHTEFFAGQYLSKNLEVGLAGYWYYQLTPDKVNGKQISNGFRGRVLGLGPCISYEFKIGKQPILTSLRYYRETHSKNHLTGDSFFFTVTLPIF